MVVGVVVVVVVVLVGVVVVVVVLKVLSCIVYISIPSVTIVWPPPTRMLSALSSSLHFCTGLAVTQVWRVIV